MKREDVLTLARAGFTAQQIAALADIQPAPAPDPAPAPAPAPTPEAAPAVNPDLVQKFIDRLDGLENAMQKNALLNSQQTFQEESADQILASIINPPGVE